MRLFVSIVLGVLASVVAFNSWVDVAGGGAAGRSVAALASEQDSDDILVSIQAFDQRAWLRARLVERRECPEILIMGSSTAGALACSMFSTRDVLNAWLTGPAIEDFEATAYMLRRQGCKPRQVLFGLDAFLFNAEVTSERWRTLQPEALAFEQRASGLSAALQPLQSGWQRFTDALSYSTTRDSLAHVRQNGNQPLSAALVQAEGVEDYCRRAGSAEPYIRHADGHFSHCAKDKQSDERVRQIAGSYVERNFHGMRSWRQVDQRRIERLFRVVDALSTRGSRVTLFAPPYHPLTFKALASTRSVRALLETLDAALARRARARSISYETYRDPSTLGCVHAEFDDSHHVKASCAARLARALMQAGSARR